MKTVLYWGGGKGSPGQDGDTGSDHCSARPFCSGDLTSETRRLPGRPKTSQRDASEGFNQLKLIYPQIYDPQTGFIYRPLPPLHPQGVGAAVREQA